MQTATAPTAHSPHRLAGRAVDFGQDLSKEHNAIEFRTVAQAEACAA